MGQIIDAHVHMFSSNDELMPSFEPDALIEHMDGPYLIGGEQRRIDRAGLDRDELFAASFILDHGKVSLTASAPTAPLRPSTIR